METLGVRMEKHVANTRAVVSFDNHDAVAGVAHQTSLATGSPRSPATCT